MPAATKESLASAKSPTPSPSRGDVVIRTQELSKEFSGQYAVQDVTLDVPRGKIFGFIGPSGSGKTTTIRLLTGLLRPTSGDAAVLGRRPSRFRTRDRQRLGYMPQLFALYPDLTVWENLNFAASLYGMGPFRGKRLNQVLDFVELRDARNKLAHAISGGMQRRLSLAATLVHNPELIFLDEPTAGIDPILRAKFWDHFRALRDSGRTLFITTQYVGEASHCDLVGIMSESRLLAVDTPEGLRRRAYGGEPIDLKTTERVSYDQLQLLRQLPGIHRNIVREGDLELRLIVDDAAAAIPELVQWCQQQKISVETIEPFQPPFDDVFVQLVKQDQEGPAPAAARPHEPA